MKKNNGAALVTVLIIVFIVMAIIANLTVTNFRMIRRLENRQLQEQAISIAYSALDFGRAGLATSGATANIDTLQDVWAQPLPKTKILDGVYMSGYLVDEQSKFNLNDLINNKGQVNPNVVNQFITLLSNLNLPQSLAYNIAFYIAAPQYQGAIMQQYMGGKPAYRPAGRPLVDLAELILVKGMTPQISQKLVQYVTAIPVANLSLNESAVESAPAGGFGYGMIVNANTASAEVIAAKSGIPLTVAQRMISIRLVQPFENKQAISSFLAQNGIIQSSNQAGGVGPVIKIAALGVNSSYFTMHAIVDDQEDQFRWIAMVYRQNRSGLWPQILWQHPE